MTTVDTDGVRNRRWIFEKVEGMALYTLMANVVRAVGRIVVWVEAAAELSTMSSSRWDRTLPNPDVPNTEWPRTDRTSPWLFGVAEPDAGRPDAGVGLGRQDDQHVGDQEDDGGEDGGPSGHRGGIGGLLVDRHRGVPSPVDEQHQQDAVDERRCRRHVEGVEPAPGRA